MLVQIGVFIIAVSFAIFSVALSRLLLRSSSVIEVMHTATGKMESKLDETILALDGTLDEAGGTISDMKAKLNALDSLFISTEQLGNAANVIGEKLDDVTEGYIKSGNIPGTKSFIRIIQSTEFAKGLLESWKRGKAGI